MLNAIERNAAEEMKNCVKQRNLSCKNPAKKEL